jgi:hypothetical protein
MSDELREVAERVNEYLNGGGPSVAYPKYGVVGVREAFEAECSMLARAYLAELDADATDADRPSWWRGNDMGFESCCEKVLAILDGKDDGRGVCGEPFETLRRRLLAEHKSDDGEEATHEWCDSVGLMCRSFYQGPNWIPTIWSNRVQWVEMRIGSTRGDVRRLCKALGIALKEGKDSNV